ncbi:hypothetical protein QWY31_07030 [Cytophagales bacterium LB-30]|uniref:DUF3108 domain-containing protein n=1 Tax=Shiella aurantiaca TaxID=3058365 RepID=A0ABT8F463_9BACT|nr:hypothetical protein [Shiella aurantiaca]MDN4165247.1 hypothetical protein [Shiella aurantiaca]
MKKHFLRLLLGGFLLGQSPLMAQSACESLYLREGATYEMLSFNAKGKQEGSSRGKVLSVSQSGNEKTAQVQFTVLDAKGKELNQAEVAYACEGDVLKIDMENFLNQEALKAYQNMEVSMESSQVAYPQNMAAGQTLDEGTMNIGIKNSGVAFADIEMSMKDRKVEGQESLQVKAGTFEVFKISYTLVMNTKMMGMNIPMEVKAVEYFSKELGVVKSESYNAKNGKLMGYSELGSYSIPD